MTNIAQYIFCLSMHTYNINAINVKSMKYHIST